MRRLLAWLLRFSPVDPNLDRREDWQPRPVSDYTEPACVPRPALQAGLCREHGGLPFSEWPGEKQVRLIADIEGKP